MVNKKAVKASAIELKHDGEITFAKATNRKSVKWANVNMDWSQFVAKLSKTVRTAETYAEYKAMKKSEQDEIKDVGGFVGGYLKNSRRKTGNVMNRSMLTLDIDFGDENIVDLIELTFPNAYVLYSTHKHKESSPRLRLVIPLSRYVTSEEYPAIGKKVAEKLGIDYFDDTTYQPHRLMYWPSTSADGDWFFDYNDAEWLNPDSVLEEYNGNWSDPMYWPKSSRQEFEYQSMAKQQGDPYEKPGLVGAFNRTYSIPEAIETFLPDVYTPFGDDRYSFNEGSTAGGLVLYDNGKFAYSHHGTDVISSKLVNSFDLVRLHLFGEQDSDKDEDTQITSMPSYKEMIAFAQKDPGVSEAMAEASMAQAMEDFSEIIEDDNPETFDRKWAGKLTRNKAGIIESTVPNIKLILSNDPLLKGKLAMNQFAMRMMRKGATPWNKDKKWDYWTDKDDAGLRGYLEQYYELYHKGKTDDAISDVSQENAFHPVRDYLDGLTWDGTKRLETLFHDYLGALDNDINRAITRKSFAAAVARIYQPGIKFDYMVTLYGSQGLGKSMILNRMGGKYFSDSITAVQGKEAYESLQGAWIIEMAELAATKKAEVEAIKHFISKQEDRFRVAYGRHPEDFPRQCVFFGTTNREDFLRDDTGGRRFWPITVGKETPKYKWTELTKELRDQLWAEAKHYYLNDEPLYLENEQEREMRKLQKNHTEESPWVGMIQDYLEIKLPKNWGDLDLFERRSFLKGELDLIDGQDDELVEREYVCAAEVWCECLGNDRNRFPIPDQRTINGILRNLDEWKPYEGSSTGKKRFGQLYGAQKAYERDYGLF